jgi:lipid II:glycine glycyltransferase (peptidoglycan interpeptide bridge formation enzyme)
MALNFSQAKSIKEIKDKKNWEDFLFEIKEKTFLNSWNWGEFQKMMGNKIWRLGIEGESDLVALALVIKIQAKGRSFLFIPHGPVVKNPKSEIRNPKQIQNYKFQILNLLVGKLKQIAKTEKVDFIRIAPIWKRTKENQEIFRKLRFREAPTHIHPEVTWLLNVNSPEEDILMNMRKNTRNLIRRAIKEGVEILQNNTIEGVERFNELYQATVSRHHFVPFSLKYLKNEFLAFHSDDQIVNFFAKYNNEIVASAMIIYWQEIGFYHQGASSQKYPKIPASYLLQWEAIKEAKKRGCKLYNFWGIIPEVESGEDLKNPKIKKHPWWGLSLFKMGFGGYKKEYLRTQDLPLTWKYWIHWTIENYRKWRRGY